MGGYYMGDIQYGEVLHVQTQRKGKGWRRELVE
jgi:hypothetical protein